MSLNLYFFYSEREIEQSCSQRHVRFNVTDNPTDSSNSDVSSHSDKNQSESDKDPSDQSACSKDCGSQSGDSQISSDMKEKDEPDCVFRRGEFIVIFDTVFFRGNVYNP